MKIRNSQAHVYYEWYLDECARSELLRVEITVLERNQKVNPTGKSERTILRKQTIIGAVGVITVALSGLFSIWWLSAHG